MMKLPNKWWKSQCRQWDRRTLRLVDGVFESRIASMRGGILAVECSAYDLLIKWNDQLGRMNITIPPIDKA
jgi:hypothetical protein